MKRELIFQKLQEQLAAALEVETHEVKLEAKIVDDLGAESIDLLDITFRLERSFGLAIKDEDLFQKSGLNIGQVTVSYLVDFIESKLS
ncbi:MAG: phosphopantetheine-binding protein [Verrucomicrobiota bacterium]